MGEVDSCSKVIGNPFMVGELPAAVIGKRVDLVLVRREARYNGRTDCLGGVVTDCPNHGVQRLALDQRDQGTAVAFADYNSGDITLISSVANHTAFFAWYLVEGAVPA